MRNLRRPPKRQLPFLEYLGSVPEGLVDVRWSQVRVLGEDLVGRHPVRDHRHDRGNREAQPPDARQPAHDSGVGGDAFVVASSC